MPHSSGGGSSGGGFHSGSSSGSGSNPTRRYSSRPFPGSTCYVYYDSRFQPRLLYADNAPESSGKTFWISVIVMAIMFFVPWAFLIVSSIHNPQKLQTNYDTSIVIRDENAILSEEDKTALTNKFQSFLSVTGITPSVWTVDSNTVADYSSLEDLAYRRYVGTFADEKHWLIMYSSDAGTKKTNWAFEGMQGNDTDPILYTVVTDRFNKTLYNALSEPVTGLSEALIRSFDEIIPNIMDQTFIIEIPILVVSVVWSAAMGFLIVSQILTAKRKKNMAKAVPLEGTPTLHTCPYCGNSYYGGTVDRCPKCNAEVEYPRYARFPTEEIEPGSE